jgi:hypothetical protein
MALLFFCGRGEAELDDGEDWWVGELDEVMVDEDEDVELAGEDEDEGDAVDWSCVFSSLN